MIPARDDGRGALWPRLVLVALVYGLAWWLWKGGA